MNMISNNLTQLSSEFKDPLIVVSSDTHTDNGINYAMVTMTHSGSNKRQHIGIALDFSTSMSQITGGRSKKDTMIRAAEIALKQMYDDNIVSVVVYGSHAATIIKNALVGHPDTIPNIVSRLKTQPYLGRTNPAAALSLLNMCDQTLLLSDGNFNEGPTQHDILHSIVKHPILCGSIFPGTDMNELAELSEGTYFNIDCKEAEHMQSLLASALSAPSIEASNVTLKHGNKEEHLPSIRNGCKIQYVIPIFEKDIQITYMDNNANMITINHTVDVTGKQSEHIKHVMGLQNAAQLAKEAFEKNDMEMKQKSVNLFQNMGIRINSYEDLRRESSSQNSQFSVDPGSLHCPETCRISSMEINQLIASPVSPMSLMRPMSPMTFK